MKANRTKMLGTIALVAVLCMQLFWIYNSFQMSVHQMGYDNPWSLAADVWAHAFFSALYQSRITLLTSLLTMVVIILSLIDQTCKLRNFRSHNRKHESRRNSSSRSSFLKFGLVRSPESQCPVTLFRIRFRIFLC